MVSYSAIHFSAGEDRIMSALRKVNDKISISGAAGTVLWGPYIDLSPGRYEARVHFTRSDRNEGAGTIDVCGDSATRMIASRRFDLRELRDGKSYISIDFKAERSVAQFETRLHCDPGASATITGVEILRFEPGDALVERWSGLSERAVSLSDRLAGCVEQMQGVIDRFPPPRHIPLSARRLRYPKLGPPDLLAARLFADRYELISRLRFASAPTVAEIGVASGEFSAFLIETLKPKAFHAFDQFGLEASDHVMGVPARDLFGSRTHVEFYRERFAAAAATVEIHVGDSKRLLPLQEAEQFDLVYVDAGHFYNDVKRDAREAARIVKRDGIIVFNDYLMFDHFLGDVYGVVQAVNELVVADGWKVVGFALQHQMFCDIAIARVAPVWGE